MQHDAPDGMWALAPVREEGAYRRLMQATRGGEASLPLFGMPENGKAPLLTAAFLALGKNMLVVCASDFAAQRLYAAVRPALAEQTHYLPARMVHLSKARHVDRQSQGLRAAALYALCNGPSLVIGSVDAARARLSRKDVFASRGRALCEGEAMAIQTLAASLLEAGYERVDTVSDYGQFAVRGGIVDVFLPDATAYRVDFFGDEIDSIRILDPLSQRSAERCDRIVIPPAAETPLDADQARALLTAIRTAQRDASGDAALRLHAAYEQIESGDYRAAYEVMALGLPGVCAADYLGAGGILALDEPTRLYDAARLTDADIELAARELALRQNAPMGWERHLLPFEAVKASGGAQEWRMSTLMRAGAEGFAFDIRPAQQFFGRMDLLCEDLAYRKKNGWRTLIVMQNERRCQSLAQSLSERGVPTTLLANPDRFARRGEVLITTGRYGAGYVMEGSRTMVLCEAEIYRNVASPRPAAKAQALTGETIEVKEGEYAVHDVHGIGVYRGLSTISVEGRPKDFLLLEYRGGDKLYIPIDQISRVHKYIGSNDAPPKLHKMGGQEWDNAKKRASQGVKKLAQDLVALYATRQALKGYAFAPDAPWQQEFEQAFEFEQTEGQRQSVEEIKRDMESPRIMDRLLCGDVGYGKTEVAMRAIFKCVMDAKQAMVLVPTTVLAQQHYHTMSARFEGYPIRVAMLSRFTPKGEQARILSGFAEGTVDVLIGTHRLLGRDVKPHNLGLLVIDEEQRFGVGHKETISDIKRTVDVLTMTATPIPRTLEMALVGIRDMSVIHTPPEERKPIETFVGELSETLLKEALMRELARDGQAYVLYNQVARMEGLCAQIRELLPQARVTMAHGQMGEVALERAMLSFYEGETDILVCSTIIENGLDIPRANTMFVLDADRLGLAQLYQLRGRVGRSARTAYCYLTYPAQKQITETADKRLEAVREFTELGSGFRLAMRDLEIRGAGNLLGPEQHGHMHNVGYDTYCRLLAQAVAAAKGEPHRERLETVVDVPLTAHIPERVIPRRREKVEAYRAIAAIETRADSERVAAALGDRYGKLPQEVADLIDISLVRALANALDVQSVLIRPEGVRMRFHARADFDIQRLLAAVQGCEGAQFTPATPPLLLIKGGRGEGVRGLLRRTAALLTRAASGEGEEQA